MGLSCSQLGREVGLFSLVCFKIKRTFFHSEIWHIQAKRKVAIFLLVQQPYIWCVSKLGNIYRSPMAKHFFSWRQCDKSIQFYTNTKDVPFRSMNKVLRNTLVSMSFKNLGSQNGASSWPNSRSPEKVKNGSYSRLLFVQKKSPRNETN